MGIKSDLEGDYDFDVVDDFLDYLMVFEASSEMTIMSLSKQELYKHSIDEVFRMFHNLKSASSFLHIDPLTKLLTLGEDILDVARECEGPASEEFVSWVLALRDQIVLWEKEIFEDRERLSPPNKKVIKIPLNVENK